MGTTLLDMLAMKKTSRYEGEVRVNGQDFKNAVHDGSGSRLLSLVACAFVSRFGCPCAGAECGRGGNDFSRCDASSTVCMPTTQCTDVQCTGVRGRVCYPRRRGALPTQVPNPCMFLVVPCSSIPAAARPAKLRAARSSSIEPAPRADVKK